MSENGEPDSEFLLGGRYTDAQWDMLVELGQQLGIADRLVRETPRANRDLVLVTIGYSPSWTIETDGILSMFGGGSWFTSCMRCGATIALRAAEDGHLAATDQHSFWHAQLEGVLPNGQQVNRE